MIRTAIPGHRTGLPESVPYVWRRSATEAQRAELEHRRVLLDRQAGYGATGRRLPPQRSEARSAAARRREEAAAPVPAPEPEPATPEPVPQGAPARCRAGRYLVTSVGHRVNCGEG